MDGMEVIMLSRIIQNHQEKYVFASHTADLEKKKKMDIVNRTFWKSEGLHWGKGGEMWSKYFVNMEKSHWNTFLYN